MATSKPVELELSAYDEAVMVRENWRRINTRLEDIDLQMEQLDAALGAQGTLLNTRRPGEHSFGAETAPVTLNLSAAGVRSDSLAAIEHGNEDLFVDLKEDPSWTWANQGGSTIEFDTSMIFETPAAGNQLRVLWSGATIPASGDWLWCVELAPLSLKNVNNQVGIIALTGGTTAAPTQLVTHSLNWTPQVITQIWLNYTTFSITLGNPGVDASALRRSTFLAIGWDDSASDWYYYWTIGSGSALGQFTAAATKPTDLGIFVVDSVSAGPLSGLYRMAKLVQVTDVTDWTSVARELYGDF